MARSNWVALAAVAFLALAANARAEDKKAPPSLDFKMKSLTGKDVNLSKYQGKVVLVVNVASACGNTPQYEGLQKLHESYAEKGLAVLGFPCNQFGKQEPGTATEIADFCKANYGVTFDMFSKVDVNGKEQAPFFKYLTSKETNPKFAGDIKWNFGKFLLDRQGNVVARFEPGEAPEGEKVVGAIKAELEKK